MEVSNLLEDTNVGIITSCCGCRHTLANKLLASMTKVSRSSTKYKSTSLYQITETSLLPNLTNAFVDLIRREVTLIILLVERQMMGLTFEVANNLGMNSFARLWITIEYGLYNSADENTPWYIMDMRTANTSHWVRLHLEDALKNVGCCLDHLLVEYDLITK